MEEPFLPEEQPEENPMDAGMAMPVEPAGIPHLDTSGTAAPTDPYGMVAPGGVDPEDDVPEEVIQAYQEDLVGRAMMMMSDNRKQKDMPSPADAFLKRINIRGSSAPEAIGGAAGTLILAITQNAKRQDVEYPAESLLGGGFEVIQLTMDLAREAGVFPDIPLEEDEEAYEKFATAAFLEATKMYGEFMLSTGQVDQQEYNQILNTMMEEEAALGELDDWDPMQMMGPDAIHNLMNRGVGLAQQKTAAATEEQMAGEMPPEEPPMEG